MPATEFLQRLGHGIQRVGDLAEDADSQDRVTVAAMQHRTETQNCNRNNQFSSPFFISC